MGCHTWFYKHVEPQPTEEQIKTQVLMGYKKGLVFLDRVIAGELDADVMEAYPEWTVKWAEKQKLVTLRQIRMVEGGFCKRASINKFCNNSEKLTEYEEGKGFYEEYKYHDVFRKYGYPETRLFSLEETLNYINDPENQCVTYEYTDKGLKEFWSECPNGMIQFG